VIVAEPKNRLPALWMITAAFFFATMGSMAHAVGSRCDWLVIAFVRILCTFLLSVSLAWTAGARLVLHRPRTLWIRSVAGTVSLVCSFYALTRLPVADVLTLTNTYPLWIVLLSMRRWSRGEIAMDMLCVLSGVTGVALIQRPYLSGRGDIAVLAALVGSLATAIAMIGLHRLREIDPRAVVAHFSGLASVSLAVLLGLRELPATTATFDGPTTLLLAGVGLTGTIGQILLTRAFAAGPPARVSVLGLTQVVFAMGFDVALEGRVLTTTTLIGFALVLSPTAWITLHGGRVTVGSGTIAKRPKV
jgi:drug/metabolite transporter (DMT)-like permease